MAGSDLFEYSKKPESKTKLYDSLKVNKWNFVQSLASEVLRVSFHSNTTNT